MFSGFDYGLLNKETNAYEILPRNETTAHLTKHLRSYGGTGEHDNYKIGRVLRQIVFSGKGFVAKPANPESVILTMKKESTDSDVKNINNFSELGVTTLKSSFNSEVEPMNLDKDVSEIKDQIESIAKSSESIQDSFKKTASDLEKQYSELSEALTASKSDSEAKADQISKLDEELKAKSEESETQVTELSTALETIASHEETIKAHEEKIASLTESLTNSDSLIAGYKVKEEEMAKKERMMKRKAQLLESGIDNDSAEATLEKFESLDDETFDAIALAITEAAKTAGAKMPPALKEALDKKKEKEEEAESKKPRMASTEAESEVASEEEESEESEETSAEILDSVEVEEEVNLSVGEEAEDSVESTRAALVDFVNSRLSTQK
jgi:chromosome segregation ATPase